MAMTGITINSIGLVLDIVGALLLWRFVSEISFNDKKSWLQGDAHIDLSPPTPDQISAYKRAVWLSRLGMLLLIVGFALQLFGNYAS